MSDKSNPSQPTDIFQNINDSDNQAIGVIKDSGLAIKNYKPVYNFADNNSLPIIFIDQKLPLVENWCGRESECQQLEGWLQKDTIRLINITGAGGYGKSALAAEIYQTVQNKGSLSNQSKVWINFSQPYEFGRFGRELLRLFGYSEVAKEVKDGDVLDVLLHHLAEKSYLLVLDNLETIIQADGNWKDPVYESFFLKWLDYGSHSKNPIESKILVTSQYQIRIPTNKSNQSRSLSLKGLLPEAAEALLRASNIQGETQELQDFCALVDGHPLLLNLVAGYLKSKEGDTPNIKALMDSSLNYLYDTPKGLHRSDPENSVKKLLDSTIQELDKFSPKLKLLLLNLSVYRIGFNTDAALAMIDDVVEEEELQALVKRSLLQVEKQEKTFIFKFQPLIKNYLLELVDKNNAHRRAINYYESAAKTSISYENYSLKDFTEHLELFYHHCQLKEYAIAYLRHNISNCHDIMSNLGYNSIILELYEPLLELWKPNKEEEEILNSLSLNIAKVCLNGSQLDKSKEYFNKYLIVAKTENNTEDITDALNGLGLIEYLEGNTVCAIEFYKKALEKVIPFDRLDILNNLGLAYHDKKMYSDVISIYLSILQLERLDGNLKGIGSTSCNLANAYRDSKEYEIAVDYYNKAIDVLKKSSWRDYYANTLDGLGMTYNLIGKYDDAIKYRTKALNIYNKLKHYSGENYSIKGLIVIYENLNNSDKIKELLEKKIALHKRELDLKHYSLHRRGTAFLEMAIALVSLDMNNRYKAISAIEHSIEIFKQLGSTNKLNECNKCLEYLKRIVPIGTIRAPEIGEEKRTSEDWLSKSMPTEIRPEATRKNWFAKLFNW